MCISCGSVARTRICNLSHACVPPLQAGKVNINSYLVGKSRTNCKGWPFKHQFQKAFSFKQPQISDKDSILTIAKVQAQIAAFAAHQHQVSITNCDSSEHSSDDGEGNNDSNLLTLPTLIHTLDNPELDPFEQVEFESESDGLPEFPPDDWMLEDLEAAASSSDYE